MHHLETEQSDTKERVERISKKLQDELIQLHYTITEKKRSVEHYHDQTGRAN